MRGTATTLLEDSVVIALFVSAPVESAGATRLAGVAIGCTCTGCSTGSFAADGGAKLYNLLSRWFSFKASINLLLSSR